MTERLPLVLVPGLLCDAALWQFQRSALAEFAGPIGVPDLTEYDSVTAMAQSILATAPPRFALAGLSMGGYVVFEILRRAPERVARVAFIDTQARGDDAATHEHRQALIRLAEAGRFQGVTPRLLPMLLHPDNQSGPVAEIVLAMAERIGQPAFLRQEKAILGRTDSRPDLGQIDIPAMVICGEADRLTPPAVAREIAEGISGAALVVVERAGHLAPLEQPEAVNRALIDWLNDEF